MKGSQKEIRSGRRGDFTLPTLLSTCRQQPLAALIAVALIAPLAFSAPALAIEANNVLVIYNADDGNQSDGYQIAQHYQQARPGVHLAPLTGINDILGGTYGEDVSGDDYLSVIRARQRATHSRCLEALLGGTEKNAPPKPPPP